MLNTLRPRVRVVPSSVDILRESRDVLRVRMILDTLCPRSKLSRPQWTSWENPEMPRGDAQYLASQVQVVPSSVDILGESRDVLRVILNTLSQVRVVPSSVDILGES